MKRLISIVVFCFLLVSCEPPQDGHGTYEYDNGTYVGAYKDGNMHGQGTFTTPDGNKYVGEWKDGKKHGQGAYTTVSGNKYVGEYKDGKPWEGTGYEKDGNVAFTYSEGVSKSAN